MITYSELLAVSFVLYGLFLLTLLLIASRIEKLECLLERAIEALNEHRARRASAGKWRKET